jgi:hypothetical protein
VSDDCGLSRKPDECGEILRSTFFPGVSVSLFIMGLAFAGNTRDCI